MPGSVPEAGNLLFLRDQVEDRVEDEVDEREPSVDTGRRKVTDGDIDLLASRLGAQLGDHRFRGIDPLDAHSTFGEWERDPACADPELQRPTLAGQVRQRFHDRRHNSRVEHLGFEIVVDGRLSLPEETGTVVLSHDPTLAVR